MILTEKQKQEIFDLLKQHTLPTNNLMGITNLHIILNMICNVVENH